MEKGQADASKIKELMTTALLLPRGVPLEVEVGSGRNWLQAH